MTRRNEQPRNFKLTPPASHCPCGGARYDQCCAPYLNGTALAPDAERLMRSRYTAYVHGDEAYLRATWHPSTRPSEPILSADEPVQWLGLEVKSNLRLRQRQPGVESPPDHDTVEFVARYRVHGRGFRLHEVSRFVRERDAAGVARWYYVDGQFPGQPAPAAAPSPGNPP